MSHRSHGRKAHRHKLRRAPSPVFTSTERIAVPWSLDDRALDELARSERIDAAAGDMIGTVNDSTAPMAAVLAIIEDLEAERPFTIEWLQSLLPTIEPRTVGHAMAVIAKAPHRPYVRIDSATSGRYKKVIASGASLRRLKADQPQRAPHRPRVAGATTPAQPASRPAKRRPVDPTYTVVTVGDCSDDTRCVIMRDEDGNLWDCLLVPVKPGVSFS